MTGTTATPEGWEITRRWEVTIEIPAGTWADLPKPYTRQVFRPDRVIVYLTQEPGEGIEVDTVMAAGQRVLKNGLSDLRLSERWYRDMPVWLADLAETVRVKIVKEG